MEVFSRKPPEPNELMNKTDALDRSRSNKPSIYKTIDYTSSSKDDDLMPLSLHQQTAQKLITDESGTSYNHDKETLHPKLIPLEHLYYLKYLHKRKLSITEDRCRERRCQKI